MDLSLLSNIAHYSTLVNSNGSSGDPSPPISSMSSVYMDDVYGQSAAAAAAASYYPLPDAPFGAMVKPVHPLPHPHHHYPTTVFHDIVPKDTSNNYEHLANYYQHYLEGKRYPSSYPSLAVPSEWQYHGNSIDTQCNPYNNVSDSIYPKYPHEESPTQTTIVPSTSTTTANTPPLTPKTPDECVPPSSYVAGEYNYEQNGAKGMVPKNVKVVTSEDKSYVTITTTMENGVVRVVRRRTANKKERRRTQSINSAFTNLRDCIPNVPNDTKLSKIKTLRLATSYISYLMELLNGPSENSCKLLSEGFRADLSSSKRSSHQNRLETQNVSLDFVSIHF